MSSRSRFLFLVLLCLAVASVCAPALAVLRLTPQSVVDIALKQGLATKNAELTAQLSYYNLSQALGAYDFNISVTPGYEYTEAPVLAGTSDAIDRTFTLGSTLSKKFISGTTLTLDYVDTRQSSVFYSFAVPTNRGPTANLTSLQLGLRQNLLANSFGYADRLLVTASRAAIDSALENREEQLQSELLNVMTLYWTAYTAEQQFRENLAAREKYSQLVKNVRRKAGFNLSAPGELPRLEAESEATESRVKASSAGYLNAIQNLLVELRLETNEQIVLDVPSEIPPVPQLAAKQTDELRAVKIGKINFDVADQTLSLIRSNTLPKLDLLARARTTGVDQSHNDAVAQMTATNHPTFYIGVEFSTPINSTAYRGQIANAEVQRGLAENTYLLAVDQAKKRLDSTARDVLSRYTVAKLAGTTVEQRERVVHELEVAYRQGRQPLVELIRAYNDLFAAQLDRATAIGQYHIGLNALAAARDELVTNVKK